MGKYIGRDVAFGLFEKQSITPDGSTSEFTLIYQAGSTGSLLVNYAGAILEPGIDYTLSNGGQNIVFTAIPQVGYSLYIIYMGKELLVPTSAGTFSVLFQAEGDGTTVDYTLPLAPLANSGLIVFVAGLQQSVGTAFTLAGNLVTFTTPPPALAKIDIFILGIERTDIVTVDPLSITNSKIAQGAVTSDKLNLLYTAYTTALETFGSMNIDSFTIHESEYLDQGRCIKIRLHATVTLSGPDNKIRFSIPIPNNGSTNVSGNVTITSATTLENGIIRWGGENVLDIYRQFGVNYSTGPTEYTVEVNMV